MKENKKYTAKDFERYHSGSMPDSEMYDLENAALQDPFVSDALEGFALSSSAQKDMEELRERLFEKEKNKSATPVYSLTLNSWWRIAALFIVIAGAGILFYKININSKQNIIAKVDDKNFLKTDSNMALAKGEKAPSQDIVAFENSSSVKSEENKITPLPETKAKGNRKISVPFSLNKESQADMATIAVNGENKKFAEEYHFKGKVIDQEGNALAAESVKEKSYETINSKDSSANLSIISPDSNTNGIVPVLGYGNKKAVLQKDAQRVVTTDKSNGAANESLLASVNRSKTARQEQMESRVAEARMKSAAPANTNHQFDEYVKKHIRPVYDENKVRQIGDVKLSFSIGKEGRPENIMIEHSSCKACEASAIELLKKGPLWNNETSSREMVLIKF